MRAYGKDRNGYSASKQVSNTTYVLPGQLQAEPSNATAIKVTWYPAEDSGIIRQTFEISRSPTVSD